MNPQGKQITLTNWSKSARSACTIYPAGDAAGILAALAAARAQRLSVIPHGAGHSYTDAALNSGGAVIDVTGMNRILAWDKARGIMQVEPGVTLRQMALAAWQDGWWPVVAPSTPEVTAAGCAAMNVNGRNAWKCGPFGAHVLALDVLLATGEVRRLERERDRKQFQAWVGGLGLLGFITGLSVQLGRISSGYVRQWRRSAACLDELFALFGEEEAGSDFMEGWLDGFAGGAHLGRGHLTCAALSEEGGLPPAPFAGAGRNSGLETAAIGLAGRSVRPWLPAGVRLANRAHAAWSRLRQPAVTRRGLYPYTYWSSEAFTGYHAVFPQGVETFQAFLPELAALEISCQALRASQQQGCSPLWCVIKKHRRDDFLLSYQVDGFSLELNYQRTSSNAARLEGLLRSLIARVIEAGGRFYLAKDHFLTAAQYRQSVGDEAVEAFLRLKGECDPETRLQSDLYRRVFLPGTE